VDVDLPYSAEAHQRGARARSRALVAHPRKDLRPVNEIRVLGKRDGGEGLARPGLLCYGAEIVVHGSASPEAQAGNDVVASNSSIEVARSRHL